MPPDPLLRDLLDAAGFDLAPLADGQLWAALDRATGSTWGFGADPVEAATHALAALRSRYAEAPAPVAAPPHWATDAAELVRLKGELARLARALWDLAERRSVGGP